MHDLFLFFLLLLLLIGLISRGGLDVPRTKTKGKKIIGIVASAKLNDGAAELRGKILGGRSDHVLGRKRGK